MNVFLLPYTWLRHLSMALWCAGAALLAWWVVLAVFLHLVAWPPSLDGPVLLGALSGSIAAASVLGEQNLRRRPPVRRLLATLLAAGVALGVTLFGTTVWNYAVVHLLFATTSFAEDAADPSLVSLTFRSGAFAAAGLASGAGPLVVRKGAGFLNHLFGGVSAGLAGGITWHLLGDSTFNTDLYLATAGMAFVWGGLHGLLVWPVPDELYAGWIRVLSPTRYGVRIPVDAPDRSPKERFVGHFPRGLDLYLPPETGVQELHLSVAVDAEQRYTARGLSLHTTTIRRFLERIDLRYDPRRPAPLETRLHSGDRIVLGGPEGPGVELEFVMLPREEA